MKTLALLFLVACTPVDSNAVTTANLRADIQVTSNDATSSVVSAWLFSHKAGDPPLNEETIRLVDDDAITAITNGSSVEMQEVDLGVEYRYDATFATAAADQSYMIALARSADRGAPNSHVSLPDPFTFTAPSGISRSAALTLSWSGGSSDQIKIVLSGCGGAQLGPIPDTGTATFPAGAIQSDTGAGVCDLAVAISRVRNGTLDPAYGQGGSIVAMQTRSGTISASSP